MKVGDKVKVKDYSGIFEIIYIYTRSLKPFYALATEKGSFLMETFKTEDDLTLYPHEQQIHSKVTELHTHYMGRDIMIALTKMLLQRVPADEVLDMLTNIDEYM